MPRLTSPTAVWRRTALAFAFVLWAGLSPVLAERRVALVIGNSDYLDVPALENPRNDAEDVAAALKRLGFETTISLDADRAAMQAAIDDFSAKVEGADVALFYYAGHAMQHQGVNYLMPVDANLTNAAGLRRMTRLNDIVADVKRAKALRIMVLDACRDNPLTEKLDGSQVASAGASRSAGLAKISRTMAKTATASVEPVSRGGDIIVYAAEAGRTAADGVGRNSPFSAAFVKYVETEGQEVVSLMRRITTSVQEETKGEQRPELSLAVPFEFYFKPGPPQPPPTVLQLVPNAKPHEVSSIEAAINAILRPIAEKDRDQARREVMVLLSNIASRSELKREQISRELPQSFTRLMQTREGIAQARELMESEPEVGPFVEIAAAAVASGRRPDMDAAQQALAQARARYAEARQRRNLENQRLNERAAANVATLAEQQANIALTGSRNKEAAEFFLAAAHETPASDPEKAGRRFAAASSALLRHGIMFFANDALRDAIKIAREDALLHYDLVVPPDTNYGLMMGALKAMALVDAADAQSMLASRTPGAKGEAMVAEARETYTNAITAVDFNAYPTVAMYAIDQRAAHSIESGRRSLPAQAGSILDEAIADRRILLSHQLTNDAYKFERVGTLNNLAVALHEASLRDDGEEGARKLEEAIALLEQSVATFENRIESHRNIARANLGRALGARAARKPGLTGQADIDRARAMFADMNKTLTRDEDVWLWAYLKRFEAQYLRMVGERTPDREEGHAILKTTLDMFQGVLAVLSRETAPNDWAIISAEIGYTLVAVLDRVTDAERPALAREAMTHFENAQAVFRPNNFKWDLVRIDEAMKIASTAMSGSPVPAGKN